MREREEDFLVGNLFFFLASKLHQLNLIIAKGILDLTFLMWIVLLIFAEQIARVGPLCFDGTILEVEVRS